MKKLLTGILMLCAYFLSQAQIKKYAVIGSSTSAGTGASIPDSSWVKRFTHYYEQLGLTIVENNLAVGGRNCYQGMPSSYIPPPDREYPLVDGNVTKALSYSPDVVVVNYPTNNYNLYTIAEIMVCLQTIKDSVNVLGKICYITTTQPRQDGNFPDLAARTKLKVIGDSIINRFGIYAIDFWTGIALPDYTINPLYSFGDGVHLNDAGHWELFRRVRNKDIFRIGLVNRAINNGNWHNATIWENREVPVAADSVVVLGARTIMLNSNTEIRALNILPGATVNISPSITLKVRE